MPRGTVEMLRRRGDGHHGARRDRRPPGRRQHGQLTTQLVVIHMSKIGELLKMLPRRALTLQPCANLHQSFVALA